MQEETTDRRARSCHPRCITVCGDRWIMHMALMDRVVTSRTRSQQIQCIPHHWLTTPTIQRRLQQRGMSARRPLLHLPLIGTTGLYATNGAMNG
ncbi:hypothetical protein TNCV_475691 [Trichonephila clavipes]|nr:hypothetical protein TNCV_475691 [Trichonephila clavipes]